MSLPNAKKMLRKTKIKKDNPPILTGPCAIQKERRRVTKKIKEKAKKGNTFIILSYPNCGVDSIETFIVNSIARWLMDLDYAVRIYECWDYLEIHASWKGE